MPGRGRGRGRGGRGRGRWSRGRGGGSAGALTKSSAATDEYGLDAEKASDVPLDINENVREFFVGTASFDEHYDAQEKNKVRYNAAMLVLEKNGVEISQNARVRALAAAWARKDNEMASALLNRSDRTRYGLVEVLKALTLLDSARRIRVEEKKLKLIQLLESKKKTTKLGKIKSNIDNLNACKPKTGSATGAICKHITRWVRQFTEKELEFFALHYPTDPWKKLADICHFHPERDFLNLPWFLKYCFGAPAPEDTVVYKCKEVTEDNVNTFVKEYQVPFSHIKNLKDKLSDESKAMIAAYTELLDYVIWNYEDLQCKETDEIILHRLKSGEGIKLRNGKLMERLLTIKMLREEIPATRRYWQAQPARNETPTKAPFFEYLVPIAETRLKSISLSLEPPIVVIGDRSGSMEVAIRTSTIIASLLTAITSAKLVFFNTQNMDAEFIPNNVEEVLQMAVTVTAQGGTAPAASLYPFYEKKEIVKTFIVVTDEEENGTFKSYNFKTLFKKYHEEVYPATIVFVSFLRSQHSTGQMVEDLKSEGITPIQFKLDGSRPDLCKLDTLFGILSSESADFDTQLQAVEADIRNEGLDKVLSKLKLDD